VHGAQDPLGHIGRAGDEEEVAAGHKKRPQDEGEKTKREPAALA
jgi:hypothetical protein